MRSADMTHFAGRRRLFHMRISRILALAALACALSTAQAPLEFEVATIKPSPPIDAGGGKVMMRIGVENDGAMVHYYRMTLKQLVQNAYRVKDYQVTGAPWMDTEQFDISAKLPDGASKDQAPDMLQTLLKDRFKVTFHREKKEYPVFALVAPKGGAKLKVADPNNAFPVPPGAPPGAPPERGRGGNSTATSNPEGQTRMMMSPSGGKVEARAITITRLAEMLSTYVGRPVLDDTAIEGKYDFSLDVAPEEMANLSGMKNAMPMMAVMAATGGGAGPGPGRGGPDGASGSSEPHPSILQSIQTYGLKLEPKKAPVDIITLDSAEKTPTEN
jgi:uncharacterized protein (TIGR03435 family)